VQALRQNQLLLRVNLKVEYVGLTQGKSLRLTCCTWEVTTAYKQLLLTPPSAVG